MKNFTRVFTFICLLFGSTFASAGVVNINTADAQALADNIYGVGLKKAQSIIEYRETNGPFQSVDELTGVKGVGEKLLEMNRENLVVTETEKAPQAENISH